ncbi:GDSL-type esterase/lipase family protein [Alkalihalobacillus sp. MEB130]|uniref:SGNH/GDSL hydrolase family protein n=1 Tax=Alkalihalobacillus sp. MEB130 TaxID=2976704 RepID=UPI0028E04720|nr:GDSL-type esterase/lipase family protein [Alkalihalobacillus sp. MEB130]MDT8858906.1 GDSL-type esterase/lipase family protein [Alkalihalobacillus sp. MEB130]
MNMGKKLTMLLFVFVLLTSLPMTTLAKGPEKKAIHYVALGDSLAWGMSPFQPSIKGLGYPEYLKSRFEQSQYKVKFLNLGYPGLTSQLLQRGIDIDPLVVSEIQKADLITISIGANDILPVRTAPEEVYIALNNLETNLQSILSTIKTRNPNANVYVMGYYNPFPYAPQDHQPALLQLLASLNQKIEAVTTANDYTYIPTDKVISKNYETYLPNPENIHLSEEGYQAVAKEFWKKIDKSKN